MVLDEATRKIGSVPYPHAPPNSTRPDSLSPITILIQRSRQPEIPDLAAQPLRPFVHHEDVPQLQIPVHDPGFVHVHDGRDELCHVHPRFGFGKVGSFSEEGHHVLPKKRKYQGSYPYFMVLGSSLETLLDSPHQRIPPNTSRYSDHPGTYYAR
jgi:hypothetical protein